MDDFEAFAEWRGGIEPRVSTLETTVEREARARAGMDEDMSDLRLKLNAQQRMLKSLGETQSEHTEKLRSIDNRLTGVETRLTSVEGTLQKVNVGVQTIIGLLSPAGDGEEFGGKSPN
jgi:chromosome segregation ATPase